MSREVKVVIIGDSRAAQKAFTDLNRVAASSQTGILKLGQRMQDIGGRMAGVGRSLTFGLTLPLLGIAVAGVKTAADFQKTMNTMRAVAGVPAPELAKLRDLAIDLGARTIFSANEAAEGMLNLSKAGISTADIMGGALANALDLAAAGDLALGDAARITANAMNTFNLSGKESKAAVDALAGAANASSADVADLALALQMGGTVASMVGLSIQETTAALAAMADQGIRGSDAGTSLKTMLLNLQPQTVKQRELMDQLGISFTKADGTFMSLTGIAGELRKEMGGLTQAQRLAALEVIFGTDAIRAANTLYVNGVKGIRGYITETEKVGNAHQVAASKMEGLPGVIETTKGAVETFLLVVGTHLEGVVTTAANLVISLAEAFNRLPSGIQQAIVGFAGVAAVAGPFLWIGGRLIQTFGAMIGPIVAARNAYLSFAAASALAGIEINGLNGVMAFGSAHAGRLAASFDAMAKSAVGFTSLLGAAVAVTQLLSLEVDFLRDKANDAHSGLGKLVTVFSAFIPVVGSAQAGMSVMRGRLEDSTKAASELARSKLPSEIEDGWVGAFRTGEGSIRQFGERVAKTAGDIRIFAGMTQAELNKWEQETSKNFSVMEGALDDLANKHKVTADQILESLQKALRAQIEFGDNWEKVVDRAGKGADGLLKLIQEKYGVQAPQIVAALADANQKTFNKIISTWNRGVGEARRSSKEIGDSFGLIGKGASRVPEDVRRSVGRVPEIVSSQRGPARAAGLGVGRSIADGVAAGIKAGIGGVDAWAIAMVRSAEAAAKGAAQQRSPSRVFQKIGQGIAEGLALGMSQATGLLERAATKMVAAITKVMDKLGDAVGRQTERIRRDVERQIEKIQEAAGDKGLSAAAKAQIGRLRDRSKADIAALRDFQREYSKWAGELERRGERLAEHFSELQSRITEFRDAITGAFSDFGDVVGGFDQARSAVAGQIEEAARALDEATSAYEQAREELARAQDEEEPDSARIAELEEELQAAEAGRDRAEDKLDDLRDRSEKDTLAGFRDFLEGQRDQARDLARLFTDLAKKGLDKDVLLRLASGGAQSLPLMEALAGDVSGELIKLANQAQNEITKLAKETSVALEQRFFGAELKKANKELAQFNKEVQRFMTRLAKEAERFGLSGLADSAANYADALADFADDLRDGRDEITDSLGDLSAEFDATTSKTRALNSALAGAAEGLGDFRRDLQNERKKFRKEIRESINDLDELSREIERQLRAS